MPMNRRILFQVIVDIQRNRIPLFKMQRRSWNLIIDR